MAELCRMAHGAPQPLGTHHGPVKLAKMHRQRHWQVST
eukprot:CAMPEP_0177570938 /NCGR_PEP_ID=MMETSP0369-20130122/77151_1 /TAXON_ID=447022 ORGANISM="Scrippsiella hangoei-like, Strain SHHI-4" /NCGR_SAMPLE_ID=MMETSP0369 /ASSEMBLY_ACC=CAM_ASM_000364 /LENGTH=37 /DNA_ID= /DNA_START= /DNA_END= /DNA_ORIENTATION=